MEPVTLDGFMSRNEWVTNALARLSPALPRHYEGIRMACRHCNTRGTASLQRTINEARKAHPLPARRAEFSHFVGEVKGASLPQVGELGAQRRERVRGY